MKCRLYFLSIWTLIDPVYFSCTRLSYISEKPETDIFRVRLTRYNGPDFTLADGTVIQKNDTLLRIHLHNVRLLQQLKDVHSDVKRALHIYHCVEQSLPSLSRYLKRHPKYDEIKGIVGITMLNRGCQKLGFEPVAIANPWYKTLKWITLFPIYYLSVIGQPSLQNIKKNQPSYLLMSKETLFSRY